MRYAVIENGKVKNIVDDPASVAPGEVCITAANAEPGWAYDGENFIEPSRPEIPYDRLRAAEFSKLDGEGMDAFRKEIAALRAGLAEAPEYTAYREKIDAIKSRHPKPEDK